MIGLRMNVRRAALRNAFVCTVLGLEVTMIFRISLLF